MWAWRTVRPLCGGVRGAGRVQRRWPELLDRTPPGFAAARGVAVRALPAAARPQRRGVPAQRAEGHRDRALHRPDPAVRAGRRGHGADADQALPAGQCARGGDLALLFLVPGWLLGHAYDAVAAVANRLALAIGGLAVVLALAWAAVLYTYRWFARHADSLLARAFRWTRMHPRLDRKSVV